MIATTPRGTLTFLISKPLGRLQHSSTLPMGSDNSSSCRRPPAIASTRLSSNRKRSITVAEVPDSSARITTTEFECNISELAAISASAAQTKASFFCSEELRANTSDALETRSPSSVSGAISRVEGLSVTSADYRRISISTLYMQICFIRGRQAQRDRHDE